MTTTTINVRLMAATSLHDNLHGLHKGMGTGTATLEAKLEQYLAGI